MTLHWFPPWLKKPWTLTLKRPSIGSRKIGTLMKKRGSGTRPIGEDGQRRWENKEGERWSQTMDAKTPMEHWEAHGEAARGLEKALLIQNLTIEKNTSQMKPISVDGAKATLFICSTSSLFFFFSYLEKNSFSLFVHNYASLFDFCTKIF